MPAVPMSPPAPPVDSEMAIPLRAAWTVTAVPAPCTLAVEPSVAESLPPMVAEP